MALGRNVMTQCSNPVLCARAAPVASVAITLVTAQRNALRFWQVGDLEPFVDATGRVLAAPAVIVACGESSMLGCGCGRADVERRGGGRLLLDYCFRHRSSRHARLGRWRLLFDFLTALADQPLIGRDQR